MNNCLKCQIELTDKFNFCPNCGYRIDENQSIADSKSKIIVSCENLTKTYLMGKTAVLALRGVDLTVHSGDFIALMGPSGSGKSTLLHLLGALDTPTKGRVYLQNIKRELIDISALPNSKLSNIRLYQTGFIFQQFYLLPNLTAKENIAIPLIFANYDSNFIQIRTKELLELVNLKERGNHLPSELSGGEQQRVAIARALANDPNLILADEPTGDLDSRSGHMVLSILKQLNEMGKTILMVSHDINIANYAKVIYTMKDGKLYPQNESTTKSEATY